jgi:DNA polymerase-3 subunit delta
MGLVLAPGVAEELAQTVGHHLRAVVGELEKLALYVHPERRIEMNHVRELVSQGVLDNIFHLTRLIGNKKYAPVCDISRRLTEQGEPIIKILSLVVAHFRKLKLLKSRLQRGPVVEAEMAALLGVAPFFVREYQDQVKLFSSTELTKIYGKLAGVSEDIRSAGVSNQGIWESFLQDVCVGSRVL